MNQREAYDQLDTYVKIINSMVQEAENIAYIKKIDFNIGKDQYYELGELNEYSSSIHSIISEAKELAIKYELAFIFEKNYYYAPDPNDINPWEWEASTSCEWEQSAPPKELKFMKGYY